MKDKLTFDKLHELLERFSCTNDVNKNYACTLAAKINNGMCENQIICIFSLYLKLSVGFLNVGFKNLLANRCWHRKYNLCVAPTVAKICSMVFGSPLFTALRHFFSLKICSKN